MWGWKSDKHANERLAQLNLSDRECFIIFDSDKDDNKDVLRAQKELVKTLLSFKARVKIVNLCPAFGKGADDQLLKLKSEFQDYIDKAIPCDSAAKELKDDEDKEQIKVIGPLTDTWNAKKLIEYFGEDIRWCDRLGGWLCWDKGVWLCDEHKQTERHAKDTLRKIMESTSNKYVLKHAERSESLRGIRAMMELAKSEPGIAVLPEDFDKDEYLLNCQNGILDLTTGHLSPHDKKKYFMKMVKAPYDPAALCPTWEWFLDDIFLGNKELVRFIQKALGYSLTGSIKEHCIFICYGDGRNGKGTLLDTALSLLGEYAKDTPAKTLLLKKQESDVRNDVAALKGKRLIKVSEFPEGRKLDEALIKLLSGGDPITARFLYKEEFTFDPTFKFFLLTNHKPNITGNDRGIWSRVKLIPFTKSIKDEEAIKDLKTKLKAELPGILAWAVRGCMDWQEEGLGHVKEIDDATEEYRKEEDILGNFLSEICIVGERCIASSSDLYSRYAGWIKMANEDPMSNKDFIRSLEHRGYEKKQRTFGPGKGCMFWHGIGLKDASTSASTHDESASTVEESVSF